MPKFKLIKLQNYFLLIFIAVAFQSIGIYEGLSCTTKSGPGCNLIEKLKITKPGNFLVKTSKDLYLLLNNSSSSGRAVQGDISQVRDRFKSKNIGFNFYYEKGSRQNAGYLLLAAADPQKGGQPLIELWDMNNQIPLYKWKLNVKKILNSTKFESNINSVSLMAPLLLDDGSLVVNFNAKYGPILKLSPAGEVEKYNKEYIFHHSIESDAQGKIYVPIRKNLKKNNKNINHFWTDGFAILDKDLNVLETHFLLDIYKKAGLDYHLFSDVPSKDPFHINDVQPLNSETKTEFVLLSLAAQSNIIAYDLNKKEIVWVARGFAKKQHDADFLNKTGTAISIFDNNSSHDLDGRKNAKVDKNNNFTIIRNLPSLKNKDTNELKIYNKSSNFQEEKQLELKINSFSYLKKNDIPRTLTEGLAEFLPKNDSLFLEETNFGRLLEIDLKNKRLLWEFINKSKNEQYYLTAWARRMDHIPDSIIKKLSTFLNK